VNTTTVAVGTSAVVVAGRWANKQPVDIKIAIGLGAYAVSLAMLSAADPGMANTLSFLVFFAACTWYLAESPAGPGLVKALGWSGTAGK
jgi:hypothetical protein